MSDNALFLILGGLGLFFFGMKMMSDGLRKIAGSKLKSFLHSVTTVPIMGVLVGAFVTGIIQSSSATTVMVVGFVNAGLLTLKQAISVIMGANIGTTMTAWIVSTISVLKITNYALPGIGIGFALMSLARTKKKQAGGHILMGLGLLFMGLYFIEEALNPIQQSEHARAIIVAFSGNMWMATFVGMAFTLIIQSSSAFIAIVQILAFKGLIPFEAAIPLVLGSNIGTTITAQLAAVGTNINARRSAMAHTIFNVTGVLYILIFMSTRFFKPFLTAVIPTEITPNNIMVYIAVFHSIFNIINTLVLLPFINFLERASIFLVPKKGDAIDFGTQYLEKHLLETPNLALEQVHNEIGYMLKVSRKAFNQGITSLLQNDLKCIDKTRELETITDNLQSEITQYIIDLSQRDLLPEESQELPVLIHNVNDIERIGDQSQNIAELSVRKIEDNLLFSAEAVKEIETMCGHLYQMFDDTLEAIKGDDIAITDRIIATEETINRMQEEFKHAHIQRLKCGGCSLEAGFIYLECIDVIEKIGDRITNVAQSIKNKMQWKLIQKTKVPIEGIVEI